MMKNLTLKIPEFLENRLNKYARQMGLSRSEIVRRALIKYVAIDDKEISGSFLDLSQDLAGSIDGPIDLSTNKKYFEGYGK